MRYFSWLASRRVYEVNEGQGRGRGRSANERQGLGRSTSARAKFLSGYHPLA